MRPTSANVHLVKNTKSSVVAYLDITFDEIFVVKGFKLQTTKKGLWFRMPATKDPNGKKDEKGYDMYYDNCYFVDAFKENTQGAEFVQKLSAYAIKQYEAALQNNKPAFEDQTKPAGNKPGFGTENLPW